MWFLALYSFARLLWRSWETLENHPQHCEAKTKINPNIKFEWVHKQFVERVHTLFSGTVIQAHKKWHITYQISIKPVIFTARLIEKNHLHSMFCEKLYIYIYIIPCILIHLEEITNRRRFTNTISTNHEPGSSVAQPDDKTPLLHKKSGNSLSHKTMLWSWLSSLIYQLLATT